MNSSYLMIPLLQSIFYGKKLCMKCLELIPVKQMSSNSTCPWISLMVKHLSHQKQQWYNKAKLSNSPEAWQCYCSLKRECQKQWRLAYHQYINNLADQSSGKITKNCGHLLIAKELTNVPSHYRWMTLLLLIVILRQKLLTIIAGQYSQVKIHLLRCTWRELPFQICHLLQFQLRKFITNCLIFSPTKLV